MPPRLVKEAPPEALEALAVLLSSIEREATVPFQERFNLIALLDKTDGGLRPIALLSVCYVLPCRVGKPVIGAWDKESHGPWGKTVGSSAEHAGWLD